MDIKIFISAAICFSLSVPVINGASITTTSQAIPNLNFKEQNNYEASSTVAELPNMNTTTDEIEIYNITMKNDTLTANHSTDTNNEADDDSILNIYDARLYLMRVYDILNRQLLPAYCSFLKGYRLHLLDISVCNSDEMKSPTSVTPNINNSTLEEITNHMKTTANNIYNISYIVLLQEECEKGCNADNIRAIANSSLDGLVNGYKIFPKFIHVVYTLDSYVTKLSPQFTEDRIVPSYTELDFISERDTASVFKQLINARNSMYSLFKSLEHDDTVYLIG